MKVLKSKLFEMKQKEQEDKLDKIAGEKKDIAWGSQIRSYVFQPYQMVKDHRTGHEVGNVGAVMDGAIDGFIEAVSRALEDGDRVELRGFGTFKVVRRAARTGRNPRAGTHVSIPSRAMPVFKPSRELRTRVEDEDPAGQ